MGTEFPAPSQEGETSLRCPREGKTPGSCFCPSSQVDTTGRLNVAVHWGTFEPSCHPRGQASLMRTGVHPEHRTGARLLLSAPKTAQRRRGETGLLCRLSSGASQGVQYRGQNPTLAIFISSRKNCSAGLRKGCHLPAPAA